MSEIVAYFWIGGDSQAEKLLNDGAGIETTITTLSLTARIWPAFISPIF